MPATEFIVDADFQAEGLGYTPPVLDGLEYWGFFGGNGAKSSKNWAPAGTDGTIVGAPTFHDGYMSVEGDSSWLDTGILETGDITALLVGRATGALNDSTDNQDEGAYFLSNRADISAVNPARNSNGLSIYTLRSNQLSVSAQAWNGTALVTGNTNYVVDPMTWGFLDVSLQVTGALSHSRIVRHKTQSFTASASSASAREPNIRPLRVGDAASLNSGKLDVAFCAIYSRALATEEKDLIYSVVKQIMARAGLSV